MDRQVGSRGRDALWSAVATRLALLDAASRRIQEDQARASCLDRRTPGGNWENPRKTMGK